MTYYVVATDRGYVAGEPSGPLVDDMAYGESFVYTMPEALSIVRRYPRAHLEIPRAMPLELGV